MDIELGAFRSDDAPRYLTIVVVGLLFPAMLLLEQLSQASDWLPAATWLSLTLVSTLLLLRNVAVADHRARTLRG